MHQLVERDCNPSGIKLTIEDALTLYISYLTDIACSALEDRKVSRYVRRRFALPPWPADRRNDCDKSLRDLLARGQVIADHFHGKWANGISAKTAKQVIEQVRILPNLPVHLIDRGVSEPLAAAQGRLGFNDEDELVRGLAVVIDVGAGTSDFGLFHVNRRVGSDEEVIAIPICQRNLRQAGDFVDECLRRFILKSTRISDSAPDFKLINDHLALNIRDFKERLFLNRSLTDVLSNSMPINITLDQFLAEPDVKDFGERMCHEFDELLNEKETLEWVRARSSAGLLIVFTGGGADLPMVQRLAHHKCHPHAIAIQNRPAARTSQFIEKNYPALVPEYPQLAVAIGGAHPDLPEEAWGGGPRSDPGIVANKSWAG
jgi:molecular chaperone HscA